MEAGAAPSVPIEGSTRGCDCAEAAHGADDGRRRARDVAASPGDWAFARSICACRRRSISDVACNLRATAVGAWATRAGPRLGSVDWTRITRDHAAASCDAILGSAAAGRRPALPSVGADWLRLAGLEQRPLPGDRVSLETLLVRPPKVLVQSRYRSGQMSRGIEWLNHPIVRNAKVEKASGRRQARGPAWGPW